MKKLAILTALIVTACITEPEPASAPPEQRAITVESPDTVATDTVVTDTVATDTIVTEPVIDTLQIECSGAGQTETEEVFPQTDSVLVEVIEGSGNYCNATRSVKLTQVFPKEVCTGLVTIDGRVGETVTDTIQSIETEYCTSIETLELNQECVAQKTGCGSFDNQCFLYHRRTIVTDCQ
jgi:hypothetical protein